MTVTLYDYMGSDLKSVNMARASVDRHETEMTDANRGRLGFLMRQRHASPFEHNVVTFYVETSIVVSREWMRHRTQAYSELSLRYTAPEGNAFLLPLREDMRRQVGKAGRYTFEPVDEETADRWYRKLEEHCSAGYDIYNELTAEGCAREIARFGLSQAHLTKFYATASLRNWLNFLSLRTDPTALLEFRKEAFQVEAALNGLYPLAMEAWRKGSEIPYECEQCGHGGIAMKGRGSL